MSRFKITCRCNDCGNKFHHMAASPAVADPPCPKCNSTNELRGLDLTTGKAPSVGGNLAVKAMDITADIVMQDHGLTDLKSDGRQGATMAPPIRADLQQAADNMFTGKLGPGAGRHNPIAARMRQIGAMARQQGGLAQLGAMRDPGVPDPISMVQATRTRPNVTLLNPRNKDGSVIS